MSEHLIQCYQLLNKTGRVFGVTINFLDEDLRDALCLYYLVLRALDTVEDDTTIPLDVRKTMLRSFDKYLVDVTWSYSQSKDEHAIVLEQFPCITQALSQLHRKYRSIILELGIEIGQGMAEFVGKEFMSVDEVNEYYRLNGGVFLIGLGRLFVASGLEAEIEDTSLLEQCGLLLHKINMARDFRKDWCCGRLYFTKDVWSKYIDNPGDFLKPENFHKGVECVNELVTDALHYIIPYLRLLNSFRSHGALKLFGIHQVMALATLERCYDNPNVFTESVKIGRDETSEIFKSTSCFTDIADKVRHYVHRIQERTHKTNGTSQSTLLICEQILHQLQLFQSNKETVACLND